MFLKNLFVYRITRDFKLGTEAELENQLAEFKFRTINPQEKQVIGWEMALGRHGSMLQHRSGNNVYLRMHAETKNVTKKDVNKYAQGRLDDLEKELCRPLKKSEKDPIKDAVLQDLLARAFSKDTYTDAIIMLDKSLIVVNATSWKKAEDFLAFLRKTIGSLPVVPLVFDKPVELKLTEWVRSGDVPSGFTIDDDNLQLAAISEEGGKVTCKGQDHKAEEVRAHIEADKLVTKITLDWQDRVTFDFNADCSIKSVKWSDELKDTNDDIDREDMAQRLDADMALVCGELNALLDDLFRVFGPVDNVVPDQKEGEKDAKPE